MTADSVPREAGAGVIRWPKRSLRLDALRAADESALAHDAEQLLALTEAMDSAAFIPLRVEDLSLRTARQIGYLHILIDAVRRRIAADDQSNAEPYGNKSSHGRIFYGWYLRGRRSKKAVWYGFRADVWARYGLSPLWVRVSARAPAWSRQRLLQAFSGLQEPGQNGVFEEGDLLWVPLAIPHFAGEDEVIAALRSQLEDLFLMLDAVIPAGEEIVPDEPRLDNSDEDLGESEGEVQVLPVQPPYTSNPASVSGLPE